VSLVTAPKPEAALAGLVYGATDIPSEQHVPVYKRPIFWAAVVAAAFFILNFLFW
jgi:solute:Na+ symporter, SSS family